MTMENLFLGFLVALGFFVSAFVGRIFRRRATGVLIGGVAGLGVSVFVLVYGLTDMFTLGDPVPETASAIDNAPAADPAVDN